MYIFLSYVFTNILSIHPAFDVISSTIYHLLLLWFVYLYCIILFYWYKMYVFYRLSSPIPSSSLPFCTSLYSSFYSIVIVRYSSGGTFKYSTSNTSKQLTHSTHTTSLNSNIKRQVYLYGSINNK